LLIATRTGYKTSMTTLNPRWWVGWMPNGLGQVKPNHYGEMVRTAWANRDQLGYAWRILRDGVCDGCALGTTGLRDWTMDGVHLCTVRLNLLRLNTMSALDPARLGDVGQLGTWTNRDLRALGRLPVPLVRRRGDPGFRRISWDDALDVVADRLRATSPERTAYYLTSRGITNEVYYVAQKVARFLGTNNVDNSARICHAPSTVALRQTLGVGASTCSYRDWIGADLIVFFGSDVPNNQPVTTKYLYYAKQRGTRIAVVNPFREPGLERYWVPSVFESAVFGTKLADAFFPIHTGGDRAFIGGVLKVLCEDGGLDDAFIRDHTAGFEAVRDGAREASWQDLERASGASREDMTAFSRLYREARSAIFVWSMGVTQHPFGVDNVLAIVNLALARGMVGREHCGLMPIRGHSGVQGGAEVGAVPTSFPGGRPVNPETAREMEALWGFPVPTAKGQMAAEMVDAAHAGELDVLYCIGGNFLETLPDPERVREALARVPVRVHQDVVVSPTMLADPAETVLLLPATTRYEQPGGGTETTTERRIVFSPEIPGRRIGAARPEWEVLCEIAARVDPTRQDLIGFPDMQAVRDEIARIVPAYDGIQRLRRKGDMVQWGGARLCDGAAFPTESGRAHFVPISLPEDDLPPGKFRVSTRRGKQFNSMLWNERDPLTGAYRNDVLMNRADCEALGLREGDSVALRSERGTFEGQVRIAPIRPRNLQVHWPEGNVLIAGGRIDPRCGIPDYNAIVDVTSGRTGTEGRSEP
jgi:molybdopterin-dependent oxidoreductase alpha subunit